MEYFALKTVLLIVADDTHLAETCSKVLATAGFACIIANDTWSALRLIESHHPAVVLADVNGEGDGFEIARQLPLKSPQTPLILMSADSMRKQLSFPAAANLIKPFSNRELISTAKSLLLKSEYTANG